MTLTTITGKLGSGKTFLATYLASKLKREIYCNFKLKLPNYIPLELFDLIELKPHVNVIIDEAYAWIDCRSSGRAINKYASYIIYHSRKTFMDYILTTPVFSTIDVRFREQSNVVIEAEALGKQYYKKLKVPKKFKYKFINRDNKPHKVKYKEIDFYDALPYFSLFDTLEGIESTEKKALEFYFILKNPKLLKKKTIDIANIIKKDIIKITHITVKFALIMNEIPLQYEPFVYAYLSGKSIVKL